MERQDTTGITCSTTELNEVAWFLKMNYRYYKDAIVTACEPGTGRLFLFYFHFSRDYAMFGSLEKRPVYVEFNGLDPESVAEALDKMVASVNEQS